MGMHEKKMYGTATVGTKGQVVIPAEARDEMGIKTGDKLYVFGAKHFVGFIKEDEFAEMLNHLTERAEAIKNLKEKLDRK
jgi:AbrB family looped-hinge helix DNA binding protein